MGLPKAKKRRKVPYPNSVLDRRALVQALEDRKIAVKPVHISAFYQQLHRQHYPDLPAFVDTYYQYEKERGNVPVLPLKNAVSSRKNKNRLQLPKKLLDFLRDPSCGFVTVTSKVYQQKTSNDGSTTKLAVQLHDGQLVESVLMRYISHDGSRASLCVSSQCGCAMGCTFCATGTMGLSGNLITGEILEQIVHADRILAKEWLEQENRDAKLDYVRNVVFMGMGEPLDNYQNVVEACRALIDRKRWNLAHGRVTVSTVGLASQIRKLTAELPEVSLALSLHAPNQEMREAIVPSAKRYPIEELIDALDNHMMAYLYKPGRLDYTQEERIKESSRRRAMIEYVMIDGPTSTLEAAHQLGRLCQDRQLIVNLIPYNQTDVKDKIRCPSREHTEEFRQIVSSYGTYCTIRKTMGADIDSACGQLITKEESEINDVAVPDIEDAARPSNTDEHNRKKSTELSPSKFLPENERTESKTPFDLETWVRPLTIATTLTATSFIVSSLLFLRQKRAK